MAQVEAQTTGTDPATLEDYKTWLAMGEGGTSHDWDGFMKQLNAEKLIVYDDTISPAIYTEPEKYAANWSQATETQKNAATKSFLAEPLPERPAPRARALKFMFPQRQNLADAYLDPRIRQAYEAVYDRLGETNTDTEWKTSLVEKRGKALFLDGNRTASPLVAPVQHEICHLHGTDMSGHVTLSHADAQEVIAKGWGERHRLVGTGLIPLGYTMLYVPRTVEETIILGGILQAGIEYFRSG